MHRPMNIKFYEMLLCHDTEDHNLNFQIHENFILYIRHVLHIAFIVHEMKKHIIMLARVSTNCFSIKVTSEILYLSSSKFES
jgi:hypothetical protein